METRVQYPTPLNEWLYQDQEDGSRIFTDYVILGKEAEPWQECTNEEKLAWEEAHPQPDEELAEA